MRREGQCQPGENYSLLIITIMYNLNYKSFHMCFLISRLPRLFSLYSICLGYFFLPLLSPFDLFGFITEMKGHLPSK